jgi:histidinol-phosphatase (PHP family)
MMIDYHVHTSLCNHARGRMEDYVINALERGISEICFMDHLTLNGSGVNNTMHKKEVPLYFEAVQVLKERFAGRIVIKSGLEVDFEEEMTDEAGEITGRFAFDAIGSSVHFLGDLNLASRRCIEPLKNMSHDRVVYKYLEKLERMLDFDYFDIICHIDLPKKYMGKGTCAVSDFRSVLKKTAEKGRVIELNTSGLRHSCQEFYPDFSIISECRELDIPFTTGSDAHSPEEAGRFIDTAVSVLKEAGYRSVCTFRNRKKKFRDI